GRQLEAELAGHLGEELVRDLHQDAGAVAGARIGADRAAMLEIAQDRERVLNDLVRLAPLDVGDEADTARILVERRIVETLRLWQPVAVSVKRDRAHDSRPHPPALAGAPFRPATPTGATVRGQTGWWRPFCSPSGRKRVAAPVGRPASPPAPRNRLPLVRVTNRPSTFWAKSPTGTAILS